LKVANEFCGGWKTVLILMLNEINEWIPMLRNRILSDIFVFFLSEDRISLITDLLSSLDSSLARG